MEKTLTETWGPTLFGRTATGPNLSVFNKAGIYFKAEVLGLGFSSGRLEDGYLRHDEIAEGKAGLKKYIQENRKLIVELRSHKTKRWTSWLELFKTEKLTEEAIDKLERDIDSLSSAKSVQDMRGHIAPIEGPASVKGDLLLLGEKTTVLSIRRGYLIQNIERTKDLKAILRLSEMGIILDDKPGWADSAAQTIKALAFLKSRKETLYKNLAPKVHELLISANTMAELAIKDALAKYPLANPAELPDSGSIIPTLTLVRK